MFNTFLTTEQVAQILGVRVERVRTLALAGSIKAYKPVGGRRYRFSKRAVAEYIGCPEEEI